MLAKLSNQFRAFAKNECENSSPLYEHLANRIADDDELLKVAIFIPQGQPAPNLLLAGVHYLLSSSNDDLVHFYPSLTTTLKAINEVYPVFKAFVLSHSEELKTLFQEKLVQTNEIRRCSYLYPMMTEIYERHQKPLAFIEIGASAGLQLGMDQYNYCYNQQLRINNSNSAFVLSSENRGEPLPASISNAPVVCQRVGIDLNPIDIHNEEELRWLQALIWPEHEERRILLNQALPILKELDLQLIKGDAIKLIKDISRDINEDAMLVVYHTHVANQIPMELRIELIEKLKEISMERPLYHCYNNLFDMQLHQDFINQGEITSIRSMERPDGHARWFKWAK
ncbi:hypothetical protein AMS59_11085 [Lysinibacillus sp. FJAT-14745]|uniref:DUF2332 domain-containing protein n=1 Tax=Lysinibacillus sp. FJAT-14745 TaxID=1704289 RepID=UPI0006ABB01E|nr:DUF2332 domain-containing protein [Lysinibacillus sp. FJAT-14745]KOP78408.1 hypothetical protein AMS59_11085 [Lysinibacillus sp. FJAT-14745]